MQKGPNSLVYEHGCSCIQLTEETDFNQSVYASGHTYFYHDGDLLSMADHGMISMGGLGMFYPGRSKWLQPGTDANANISYNCVNCGLAHLEVYNRRLNCQEVKRVFDYQGRFDWV